MISSRNMTALVLAVSAGCSRPESAPIESSFEPGREFVVPEAPLGVVSFKIARAPEATNHVYESGDVAKFLSGGSFKVLGEDPRFGVLCEYTSPVSKPEAYRSAPSGTLIFLDPHELGQWDSPRAIEKINQEIDLAVESVLRRR